MVNNMANKVDVRDAYIGEKRKQIREGSIAASVYHFFGNCALYMSSFDFANNVLFSRLWWVFHKAHGPKGP